MVTTNVLINNLSVGDAIGNQVFGSLSSDLQGIISSIAEHGNLISTSLTSQNELNDLQEIESKSNILSAVQAISSALASGHDKLSNAMTDGHEKVASSVTAGHDKLTSALTSAQDKVSSALTNGHEKISATVVNTNRAINTMAGAIQVRFLLK